MAVGGQDIGVLEHPVRPGYELIDGKPAEKTASAYRFEVPVEGDSTKKFAIVEERMYDQQMSISNMPYEQLLTWTRNKDLNEEGRQKLGEIAVLKLRIAETQQEEQRVNQRVQEMSEDQSRLRSNISTLRSVTGQQEKVNQYAEQLAAHETELVEMRDRQAELRRQADELQSQLNTLIETMEF